MLNAADRQVLAEIKRKLRDRAPAARAIVLMGSTANAHAFKDWDDFDVHVYTRSKPKAESYYEILTSAGRHLLLSAYFYQLDSKREPGRTVMEQDDVEVLFGDGPSLRHIYIQRPRRVEPLPHELPKFTTHAERFFEILVDIFFILNRYEARGRPTSTKARVARDGLRTICQHFYLLYGVHHPISKRMRWRKMMRDVDSLLAERRFADGCQNREFVRAGIELLRRA